MDPSTWRTPPSDHSVRSKAIAPSIARALDLRQDAAIVLMMSALTPGICATLFGAGLLAGGINSVAGGGGFITLPVLLFAGLPPVLANASGSVAVWPGSVAGLFAYRAELRAARLPLRLYLAMGAIGGLVGALILTVSSNRAFMALLPYLLLAATVLFMFGDRITKALLHEDPAKRPRWIVPLALAAISIYGGYFGGGMGIVTLAMLALIGMRDIHEMNAVKSLLVVVINGAAVTTFIILGMVSWPQTLAMMVGCIVGGYTAGRVARRIDRRYVRALVSAIACAMTAYFLDRAWFG